MDAGFCSDESFFIRSLLGLPYISTLGRSHFAPASCRGARLESTSAPAMDESFEIAHLLLDSLILRSDAPRHRRLSSVSVTESNRFILPIS